MRRIHLLMLSLAVMALSAAPAKKKPAPKPAAPRVTAAQRSAAQAEIARRIAAAGSRFENPEALEPYFEALKTPSVHILQFGDSHTASDDWVNSMRVPLQAKYGDGGPGWIQAGSPYRGYRRFDAHGASSPGWYTEGTMAQRGDPNQGLSGVSISTQSPGQTVRLSAAGQTLSLFYLQQPGGGRVRITIDDRSMDPIATDGPPAPGVATWPLPNPGPHEISLETLDHAPVRLFGWTLDNSAGLTFETLGINGAQARAILGWDETLWDFAMAARKPALVILAYGTNEANSRLWTLEDYRADLKAIIDRVRRAAPQAAILMIGPPDCGRGKPLLHLSEVEAAQLAFAREEKVAFWDWRAQMGGPGAVKLMVTAGYGQADFIHMTGEGYRLTGETIVNALEARREERNNEQAGKDHGNR
jgi:lysophospholipase L1-like esterase